MPDRHIALLRGINVGRAKRVAMADLRALVEALGYRDVQTLLNSGNVIFGGVTGASRAVAARIEAEVAARLGVSSRVTVLSAAELTAAIANNPFGEIAHDPSRLLVTFLNDSADGTRLAPLTQQNWSPEALAVESRFAYLWCPPGIIASRLAPAVNSVLRDAATARNWATVIKLHALATAQTAPLQGRQKR